jgi:hypothetical protein
VIDDTDSPANVKERGSQAGIGSDHVQQQARRSVGARPPVALAVAIGLSGVEDRSEAVATTGVHRALAYGSRNELRIRPRDRSNAYDASLVTDAFAIMAAA